MTGALQIPAGPKLHTTAFAKMELAAGRFLKASYLKPIPFADYPSLEDLEITTGIYLVTDTEQRVRWLGQTNREGDLVARLDEHARNPEKIEVFSTVRVLHLADLAPPEAIDAIEGRCADQLKLRGTMGQRRWPKADNWLTLVA